MSEWQPIETAPQETPILVWCEGTSGWDHAPLGVWVVTGDGCGDFYVEHDADGNYMEWLGAKPTHWMPLPDPPA